MDSAHDIPDSTDWLHTPLKDFAQLENALHCQICKEFYDTPMITSCAHTFCSKCIRTSLSADGKCPACRAADQASKLRNNWALQEVVATFLAARPAAIDVARREEKHSAAQSRRPGKRKRVVQDADDIAQEEAKGMTTRRKSRRLAASQTSEPEVIEVEDTDGDDDFEPEVQPQADDGLVECPLGCGKRMKIEQVEPHLDRCEDEKKQERRAKSRTPANGFGVTRSSPGQISRPQERLAELNYSLLKEQPLRKKLEELGIPGSGSKQLMVRRHTEWVNLWNANCDSSNPRSKRELLQDLDIWERTQGGKAPNVHGSLTNGVMRKDFDGPGWASRNRDDFSRLIADARRKKNNPVTAPESAKEDGQTEAPILKDYDGPSPFAGETPTQHPPPLLKTESSSGSAPYADDPDAMASVREKVEAANAGRHIEPVMNEGFRIPELHSSSTTLTNGVESSDPPPSSMRKSSDPAAGAENPALLAQSRFGHDHEASVTETHASQIAGSDAEVAAPLQHPSRKLCMFAVPSEPFTDFDGGGGDHSAVQ